MVYTPRLTCVSVLFQFLYLCQLPALCLPGPACDALHSPGHRMNLPWVPACRRQLLRQWWEAQDALYRRHRISGAAAAGRIKLGSGVSPAKVGPGGISPPKLPGGVCAAQLAAAAAAKVAAKKAARAAAGSDSSPTAALGSNNIKAVRPGSARK